MVEMARASGLRSLAVATIRCARRPEGRASSSPPRSARGAARSSSAWEGARRTDGGLAAVEALGWSLGRRRRSPSRATCRRRSSTRPRCYGPQKGASDAQVGLLDARLERLAEQYQQRTGVDVSTIEGAGAAGGLAGGLAAIGAQLEPGFDVVAEAAGLEDALDGVELVVTGEGRLDATSFDGKVVGACSSGRRRRASARAA